MLEEEEEEEEQDERGGVSGGRTRWSRRRTWLVGEDDGGLRKGQEGPCCAVLHKSISRGCINTTQ